MTTKVADWIRPWYPDGLIGHIYADCDQLGQDDPAEGAGWLDPRADARNDRWGARSCPVCLTRHDPELAAELGVIDE